VLNLFFSGAGITSKYASPRHFLFEEKGAGTFDFISRLSTATVNALLIKI
jgi:hypothetical protein